MSYTVDKENLLREARKRNRFGSIASLARQGVGNDMAKEQKAAMKTKPAKKTAKKTSAAKKDAPKTSATAKKATTKKTTKKS